MANLAILWLPHHLEWDTAAHRSLGRGLDALSLLSVRHTIQVAQQHLDIQAMGVRPSRNAFPRANLACGAGQSMPLENLHGLRILRDHVVNNHVRSYLNCHASSPSSILTSARGLPRIGATASGLWVWSADPVNPEAA